ncbi:DUF397 domain-containing protein [Actinoplanes sp. CA-030573]|uniref:DUF397 domain-containing protein n=1 Tax=Actinoplanes sp. CA-030573 TaxID=3239898 RepID=UPI003D8E625B
MPDPFDGDLRWQRSSRCVGENHCVEVARAGDVVMMRDSKNPAVVLTFGLCQWRDFTARTRSAAR